MAIGTGTFHLVVLDITAQSRELNQGETRDLGRNGCGSRHTGQGSSQPHTTPYTPHHVQITTEYSSVDSLDCSEATSSEAKKHDK